MFEGQARHYVLLVILLAAAARLADQATLAGEWAGQPT